MSNRQRIGFFDRTHLSRGLPSYTAGLQATGLLVTAAQFTPPFDKASFAVVPADNTLALNDSAYTYQGDLFGPDTKSQITPWTRPNVAAFTSFPEDLEITDAHFQAIDNIRYSGGPNMEMAFDYSTDFRMRPVIREDSWMGRETTGVEFTTDVVVSGGSTLTIETDIRIASRLVIDSGSTVVISESGRLTITESGVLQMARESNLTGPGDLVLKGGFHVDPGAKSDFPLEVGSDEARESPFHFSLSQNYPNPFNALTAFSYHLPEFSDVVLTVYDTLGRQVRELASGKKPAGTYEVNLDATHLHSGVYFYRLQAADYVETRRMVIVR